MLIRVLLTCFYSQIFPNYVKQHSEVTKQSALAKLKEKREEKRCREREEREERDRQEEEQDRGRTDRRNDTGRPH